MIDWFMNLSVTNQIAIIVAGIAAGGGIIVAIINGLFSVFSKNLVFTLSKNFSILGCIYLIRITVKIPQYIEYNKHTLPIYI